MRKKNFKKGPFVYRRTLTLADKKKGQVDAQSVGQRLHRGSKPSSSSAQRDRRLMRYFLYGMPSKQRMHICMLLAFCALAMALGKFFPDKSNEESDMEKRNT